MSHCLSPRVLIVLDWPFIGYLLIDRYSLRGGITLLTLALHYFLIFLHSRVSSLACVACLEFSRLLASLVCFSIYLAIN